MTTEKTASAKYVPGDVVRFKSGGPTMTVLQLEKNENNSVIYLCGWFVRTKLYRTQRFPPEGLVKE